MAGKTHGERKMSFGIGGAGNIRTVSEATVYDYYISGEGNERRRSSAGSMPSALASSWRTSVFASIKSMFGSDSTNRTAQGLLEEDEK